MSHNWILDVLADLKAFAQQNELVALAEQLDDATLIAATELASKDAGAPLAATGDGRNAGTLHRAAAQSGNA